MNQNNVYYVLCDYWSRDKSKAPNNLQSLIGANQVRINVELANMVLRTLKAVVSESGEYYLECNNAGSMLSYNDKPTGVILENQHLPHDRINMDVAVMVVQTLPDVSTILKSIQEIRAARVPQIPESVIAVISDCMHKIEGNGGYNGITGDNMAYNGYILSPTNRIMLANVIYSINNGREINNEYNAYALSQVAKSIKTSIIRMRLVKDTLPKNAELPIMEKVIEWCISPDLKPEDKLKSIGIF